MVAGSPGDVTGFPLVKTETASARSRQGISALPWKEKKMEIVFAAAENGALPGGKVGGVGDVIRDLPPALAACGCPVTVVTPSHGFLHRIAGAARTGACDFLFRGEPQTAEVYRVKPPSGHPGVTHLVIHHPAMSVFDAASRSYRIYAHDPTDRPFFTDSSRFALFSAAVCSCISSGLLGSFQIIHLHDWHAALVLLLGRFHPEFSAVAKLHSVYSIHNLAYQGVRPLRGGEASLAAWFPELSCDWSAVADPRWHDCINPMAVGIRLADRVHTVSPSYAEEIRRPGRKPESYGGEGLETDLNGAFRDGRLAGILNGCTYDDPCSAESMSFQQLLGLIRRELIHWSAFAGPLPAAHFVAHARIRELENTDPPETILTAVSRASEQKMLLMRASGKDGKPGLHAVLEAVGQRGCLILLGTGDPQYERFLTESAGIYANFIFLNGFSEKCAQALYAAGDLFLMPSSFEPCGLSQMLAMRAGQPCVVHAVGGLKDTVRDGTSGFTFSGATLGEQVDNFVETTSRAIRLKRADPAAWDRIRRAAAGTRFTWRETAEHYVRQLYDVPV